MEFILYFLISWSVVAYLVTTAKRDELAGCVIIYTVVNLTIVSLLAVITEKLKWIDISQDIIKYLSFLMNRFIITPFLAVILNRIFWQSGKTKKTILLVLFFFLLLLMEYLSLNLRLYSYSIWSFGMPFFSSFSYIAAALLTGKLVQSIQEREAGNDRV